MTTTTVLLMDSDGPLAETLRAVVVRIDNCRLERVTGTEAALLRMRVGGVGVLVSYVGDAQAEQKVAALLHDISEWRPSIGTIVVADRDDPQLRLRLVRRGAVDCLPAPPDASRLGLLIDLLTVRQRHGLSESAPQDAAAATSPLQVDGFLLGTHAMRGLLEQCGTVAALDSTILLTGETGTGKSHFARVIHGLSPRKGKPFVVVQCSALSPSLLESELFGHVRGAFTSADRDHSGKFSEAQDGTILLDEIDCIPLESQAKLLRAVEDRVFEPVGGTRSQPLRARLIVASNRPLEAEVAAGRFRSDLFYRLNVVGFWMPPLRERRELIRPLAEKFLAQFSARTGRNTQSLSAEAVSALEAHEWPGNIRELRNVIERATALCPRDIIEVDDLPDPIRRLHVAAVRPPQPLPCLATNQLAGARMAAESERLSEALLRHNNNRSNAAAELGISRVTLYKKLRQYGLM